MPVAPPMSSFLSSPPSSVGRPPRCRPAPSTPAPRLIDRLPGAWFNLVVAGAAGAILFGLSAPGTNLVAVLAGMLALSVLFIVWTVRMALWSTARRLGQVPGSWRRGLVAPTIVFVAFGLAATGTPLTLRWLTSRSAFDARRHNPAEKPSWLGAYHIADVYRLTDGATVFVEARDWSGSAGGPFMTGAGFAYLPDGPTEAIKGSGLFDERTEFGPLGDQWYSWSTYW